MFALFLIQRFPRFFFFFHDKYLFQLFGYRLLNLFPYFHRIGSLSDSFYCWLPGAFSTVLVKLHHLILGDQSRIEKIKYFLNLLLIPLDFVGCKNHLVLEISGFFLSFWLLVPHNLIFLRRENKGPGEGGTLE